MSQPHLAPAYAQNSLVGRAEPCTYYAQRLSQRIIHFDLSNGLGVPRWENPPPLQAYEWPIGDRGANILHDPSPTQLF